MTDEKYNGWTNWETWNCNLHFDDCFSDEAADCWESAEADKTFTRAENAALALKDIIEESVKESIYLNEDSRYQGILGDIISGYLSSVNWYEIARAYIDGLDTEEESAA